MPAMIRTSGHMWGPDGEEHDTLAVIPDSSYAGIYQVVIDDCRANGAFDPATMGSVPNVGLMAQAAEEYGSHDKTFEIPADGTVRVVDGAGTVLLEHEVSAGDIWRACQTKDVADPRLGQARRHPGPGDRRAGGVLARRRPGPRRQPDRQGRDLPRRARHRRASTSASSPPVDAMALSLERIRRGEDTISVTGNVLRDYLTDLFPIMELGTSAKMLSVVPLINGGGLFETGAGGSAPEARAAARQGELPALGQPRRVPRPRRQLRAVRHGDRQRPRPGAGRHARPGDRHVPRREQVAGPPGRPDRQPRQPLLPRPVLGRGAGRADRRRRTSPRRSPGWPRRSPRTRSRSPASCSPCRASPVDLGGYYRPDPAKTAAVMRPSATFNEALAEL